MRKRVDLNNAILPADEQTSPIFPNKKIQIIKLRLDELDGGNCCIFRRDSESDMKSLFEEVNQLEEGNIITFEASEITELEYSRLEEFTGF